MGIFRDEKQISKFSQHSENCLWGEFVITVYCSTYGSEQESGSFYPETGDSNHWGTLDLEIKRHVWQKRQEESHQSTRGWAQWNTGPQETPQGIEHPRLSGQWYLIFCFKASLWSPLCKPKLWVTCITCSWFQWHFCTMSRIMIGDISKMNAQQSNTESAYVKI